MLLRLLYFTLLQFVFGLLLWFVSSQDRWLAACVGVLVGAYFWFALDILQGIRFLRWLQIGDCSALTHMQGIWGDAAERVRRLIRTRERLVHESERRLQDFLAAMQASPHGVVLLDAQGRIEWFNQTAASHFGLDANRDTSQHFCNLVRDPGFVRYFSVRDFRQDVVMPGRENTSGKPVQISVHAHPYGEGRNLLLSRDTTVLEQAEVMRRDFVANVSHEIRTPLTVLLGFVETLQSLPIQEYDRQRYLSLIAQQAQRMESLVSDLLMLSRLEGSPLPSMQEWVGVKSLLSQCEQDARNLSSALGARVHDVKFVSDTDYEIAGSASELLSGMFNLISNAIRYTPADQPITVSCTEGINRSLVFSVQDSGPGIAPEHVARLTERFYRVDRSRSRDTGGTGLGLAIVKHVAQRHAAELSIESVPGKGSKFSLIFPVQRVRHVRSEKQLAVAP